MTVVSNRFWEQGSVEPLPNLIQQVSEGAPRPRVITSTEPNGAERTFREDQGMAQLFLATHAMRQVLDPACQNIQSELIDEAVLGSGTLNPREYLYHAQLHEDAEQLQRTQRFLKTFTEQFTFLGTPEYERSCAGIAQAWAEYLEAHPRAYINVSDMQSDILGGAGEPRSFNQVPKDVVRRVPAALQERVICDAQQWQESDDTITVALDDWAISGNTLNYIAQVTHFRMGEVGKTALAESFQIHLLASAPDYIGDRTYNAISTGKSNTSSVRSFYQTSPVDMQQHFATVAFLSGAHASVDYGFDNAFGVVRRVFEAHDLPYAHPLLCNIKRQYTA